jgi:steroid delta-isomerase-like uncharacterized protein
MTEDERGLGRRWFEEVWNRGRREAIPEMLAPGGVLHERGLDSVGPDGFYPFFDRMHTSMEEIQTTVHDTIAEGDCLCIRWSFTAKHSGSGLGIPATGRTVHVTGISIIRVVDGKVVEGWQNWDMLGMMEQIRGTGKAATYVAA